jgi:hypothetical protein
MRSEKYEEKKQQPERHLPLHPSITTTITTTTTTTTTTKNNNNNKQQLQDEKNHPRKSETRDTHHPLLEARVR